MPSAPCPSNLLGRYAGGPRIEPLAASTDARAGAVERLANSEPHAHANVAEADLRSVAQDKPARSADKRITRRR